MSIAGLGYLLKAKDVEELKRRIAELDAERSRLWRQAWVTSVVGGVVLMAILKLLGEW